MGKQITYGERDKSDAYKAKDYAVGYEKSTSGTSRDVGSTYKEDYSRGLGGDYLYSNAINFLIPRAAE